MFETLSFQNVVFWHKSSRGGVVLSVRECAYLFLHAYFGRDIPKVVKVRHWPDNAWTDIAFSHVYFLRAILTPHSSVLTWHARLRSVLSEDLFWESREFVFPLVFSQVSRSLFQNLEKRIRTCCFASASAPLLACRFQCECSSELGHFMV